MSIFFSFFFLVGYIKQRELTFSFLEARSPRLRCKKEWFIFFFFFNLFKYSFPGGTIVKNILAKAGDTRGGFDPWVGKILWRMKWQLSPVLLPGKSHGQRSLGGYSPRGLNESDTHEHLIVDFQCCINISYTAKWIIYTYIYTHSFS